ncbi:hypothetical protein EJ110_NYTH15559 [Nymphaea thermarum]|nr:hypothetical protein EJ110_NYTH15559 [Nymphaea thermarum]
MMTNHYSSSRSSNQGVVRVTLILVGICLVSYVVGPPLYWRLVESFRPVSGSCPPCECDCSTEAIFSLPLEVENNSLADCGKHDADATEEMEKSLTDLLLEELKLQEIVALDRERHSQVATIEAKKLSAHYQKEAEKCNAGMETCEEARERAEVALTAEKKLSLIWENRARQLGWSESDIITM